MKDAGNTVLTKKEWIPFRVLKGNIKLAFIDENDASLLDYAAQLLALLPLAQAQGQTRGEIEETVEQLGAAYPFKTPLKKGLEKLFFDLIEFDCDLKDDITERRKKVFLQSSVLLEQNSFNSYQEYMQALETILAQNEVSHTHLYSDLPEFHRVVQYKESTPQKFLQKYNVSLVQGLLFHSEKIEVTIPNQPQYTAHLRYFLRQVKFFQLVANFKKTESDIVITLDGPLSLFNHAQKYGLQLACVFPSLLHVPQWTLSAEVQLKKTNSLFLKLTETCQLTPPANRSSIYIPKEYELFETYFKEKYSEKWDMDSSELDILFDGQTFFFPDYKFVNRAGQATYLELFHPWHARSLSTRLENLQKSKMSNVFVGADKSLLKDKELSAHVQASSFFEKNGFVFRGMPSAQTVFELLSPK